MSCCRLLSACEIALDLRRAEEWMQAAPAFEEWKDWISPVCRNHYGGILVAAGRWAEAETELESAIRTFERSYRLMREEPLVKLADLRVRQGRYEEARDSLRGTNRTRSPVARSLRSHSGEASSTWQRTCVHLCLESEGAY